MELSIPHAAKYTSWHLHSGHAHRLTVNDIPRFFLAGRSGMDEAINVNVAGAAIMAEKMAEAGGSQKERNDFYSNAKDLMQKWPFNIEFYLHKHRNNDENHGGDKESYGQTSFISCPRSHPTPN